MNPTFGRAPACDRASEALSLRLDGELSEHEDAWLRAHLQSCAACRALAREVEGVASALRAAPLVAPARPVVMPRLRSSRVGSFRPLVAAAASVVVLGGTVGTVLRANFASQSNSSLRFRTPSQQAQFVKVAHNRAEANSSAQALDAVARQAKQAQSWVGHTLYITPSTPDSLPPTIG